MGITKVSKNLIGDSAVNSDTIADNSVGTDEILNNTIANADISPQASISFSKLNLPGSASDLLNGAGAFQAASVAQADTNTFNIGVLGFKMAVAEGLTLFNLKDGVVDEFNDESGVDTAENVSMTYDSASDFYSGGSGVTPSPPTQDITTFTSTGPATYSVESGVSSVNVFVIGGGGGGGTGGYNNVHGGGAGAGGAIYYPNYPVTPGGTVAVVVGAGGEGGGFLPPAPGSTPYTPTARPDPSVGTGEYGGYESPLYNYPMTHTYYGPGQTGSDSSFGPLVGEGGGAGGGYLTATGPHPYFPGQTEDSLHSGGCGGAAGGSNTGPGSEAAPGTQNTNHPIPLTPAILPENSPGGFGNAAGAQTPGGFDNAGGEGACGGGGGIGGAGEDTGTDVGGDGGVGLNYNVLDGTTSVGFGGGGIGAGQTNGGTAAVPFGGGTMNPSTYGNPTWKPGFPGGVNRGGGGSGANNPGNPTPAGGALGGDGGPGIVVVKELARTLTDTSTTLISDTFTASSTPTKARIVVFGEINSTLNSQLSASATRDNTTFNAITLTDNGYVTGSSGAKIYTGSTPLTGTASPQVQVRWKIVGAGLSHINTIHGVSLQWA
jgi:hypothetical protein